MNEKNFIQQMINQGIKQEEFKRKFDLHEKWLKEQKTELRLIKENHDKEFIVINKTQNEMVWVVKEWRDHIKASEGIRNKVERHDQFIEDLRDQRQLNGNKEVAKIAQNGQKETIGRVEYNQREQFKAVLTVRIIGLIVCITTLCTSSLFFFFNFIFK